jgi:O-antigen ligase
MALPTLRGPMRSVAVPPGRADAALSMAGTTPIGLDQATMTLAGLGLYLFCVHSFKLPLASLGIAIGVLGVLSSARQVSLPAPLLWMGAWLVWCGVTGFASPYRGTVGDTMLEYLKIFLIFFVALNAAKTLSQLAIFIGSWVLLFGLYPVRGTYLNFFAGINQFGRYGWNFSFSNYNDLAAYAILVLAMCAFLLAGRYSRSVRSLAFLGAGSLALLLILTQSRGAFAGLALGFLFLLVRSRIRGKLIRFSLLAVVTIVLLAPGAVWERFSRMQYLLSTDTLSEADSSAEQRYVLLQVGLTIARENLVKGVGLGAYPDAHSEYAEERAEWQFGRGNRDTHNMYLNLAAETGVPGTLLFLGMLAATLRHAIRTEQRLRDTLPIEFEHLRILRFGLVAYLIAAIFGTFHRISFLYMYVAVLWSASQLFADMLTANLGVGSGSLPQIPGPPRTRGWSAPHLGRLARARRF